MAAISIDSEQHTRLRVIDNGDGMVDLLYAGAESTITITHSNSYALPRIVLLNNTQGSGSASKAIQVTNSSSYPIQVSWLLTIENSGNRLRTGTRDINPGRTASLECELFPNAVGFILITPYYGGE